jgi:hypothetical protein
MILKPIRRFGHFDGEGYKRRSKCMILPVLVQVLSTIRDEDRNAQTRILWSVY